MRLAILSIHSSPMGRAGSKDTGGMSTYLRSLSSALGRKGHQVDLYTRRPNSGRERVENLEANVRLIYPGDGLAELDKNHLYSHCPAVADSIDRFSRLEKINYDFIYSHYWLSGISGRLLKKRWNKPHLIMFHTLARAKNELCPGEKEPQLRLETEAELARDCDLVVTAAESEKRRILNYYNLSIKKTALIPCGIERSVFHPINEKCRLDSKLHKGAQASGKTILAVGRIEPVKGFELLIEAVSLLPSEDDFKVVIIGGEGSGRAPLAALKDKVFDLGLSDRVFFTGVVEHSCLPFYYNAADITVIPSYYESFGLVALESIACGTPVIASPVGGVPELVGQNNAFGCLVKGRDPVSWAAAIRKLYTKSKPIPHTALETGLTPYSWPDAAEKLELALSSL